ncbi:DUF4145 domain-containing protein [Desulfobacula sp.]|uniref:DUF4145 domain-containing protein n=1 Tax=Desulfobacula sp. TaxID=2593537 RepID=UPI0025BC506D|nr:DUF4145 domain-containing protein [Desulfobacula sp.]MBC2704489.1 DUF4145 domain-containing protein [Desulfobacula sp.]
MPDSNNFWFLNDNDNSPIYQTASDAERFVFSHPNVCLIRLRQFGEFLAKEIAILNGKQDLLQKQFETILKELGKSSPPPPLLPREIKDIFHTIRKKGNEAVHSLIGDEGTSLYLLKKARELAIWYQKSYRTEWKKTFGKFTAPSVEIECQDHFNTELKLLKNKLTDAEEETKKQSEEANAAMELAEELEGQFLKYAEGINNIINSNNFDLNRAKDLASEAANDINLSEDELSKIVEIKYYAIGFKVGLQKQKKLSESDKNNIQRIKNKYGGSDSVGMADEIFSEYNKDWAEVFVKTISGYVLKGLIIDESTKELFYDEDRCAETFYQYMVGFCDGLIKNNKRIHH